MATLEHPLYGEDLIRLSEFSKIFPTRPNPSTAWRWAKHGTRGVILETVAIGGTLYTSREAANRFLEALNQPKTSPVKTPRSRKQRTASKKKAEAILAARGI